jgi:hypothetical protein
MRPSKIEIMKKTKELKKKSNKSGKSSKIQILKY